MSRHHASASTAPCALSTAQSPSRRLTADIASLDESWSLTLVTACAVTGFAKEAMYDLIRAAEIKSFMFGKRRYILASSLRDYLERRAAEPLEIRIGPNSRQQPDYRAQSSRRRARGGKRDGSEGPGTEQRPIIRGRKGQKFGG